MDEPRLYSFYVAIYYLRLALLNDLRQSVYQRCGFLRVCLSLRGHNARETNSKS